MSQKGSVTYNYSYSISSYINDMKSKGFSVQDNSYLNSHGCYILKKPDNSEALIISRYVLDKTYRSTTVNTSKPSADKYTKLDNLVTGILYDKSGKTDFIFNGYCCFTVNIPKIDNFNSVVSSCLRLTTAHCGGSDGDVVIFDIDNNLDNKAGFHSGTEIGRFFIDYSSSSLKVPRAVETYFTDHVKGKYKGTSDTKISFLLRYPLDKYPDRYIPKTGASGYAYVRFKPFESADNGDRNSNWNDNVPHLITRVKLNVPPPDPPKPEPKPQPKPEPVKPDPPKNDPPGKPDIILPKDKSDVYMKTVPIIYKTNADPENGWFNTKINIKGKYEDIERFQDNSNYVYPKGDSLKYTKIRTGYQNTPSERDNIRISVVHFDKKDNVNRYGEEDSIQIDQLPKKDTESVFPDESEITINRINTLINLMNLNLKAYGVETIENIKSGTELSRQLINNIIDKYNKLKSTIDNEVNASLYVIDKIQNITQAIEVDDALKAILEAIYQ